MSSFRTKLEKKIDNNWKFAIKNAFLIAVSPIIAITVSTIVYIPLGIISIIIDFRGPSYGLSGIPLLIGLFVSTMMLLKVILNFIDYYKEKYTE